MDSIKQIQPLNAVNRLFAGKEPWQIVSITAGSVLVVVWTNSLLNGRESATERIKQEFFRWMRKIPAVRRKIDKTMDETISGFQKDVTKRLDGLKFVTILPEKGLSYEEVTTEVRRHVEVGDYDWKSGHVSGAVYHTNADIVRVATEAYAVTAYSNPLHADVFPGINKMEAEIVRMAVEIFHGDSEACGSVTTGGTESIILACKAFRDLAYSKGISNPQIVVGTTVHSAFDKAAQYLGLSVKTVPLDPITYKIDLKAMKKAIGRRTCLIVGSAPNFPYGTMDDIEALSSLAVKYDIPLHVDACLGGWLSAFMPAAGYHVPKFDFSLPGVASISADTHKYGYAPKGSSVLLFRKPEYRHHQYTVTTEWPGGVYGSPTINGSRAGGIIAACWATMMFLGKQGYTDMTKKVVATARSIEKSLREIDGIFIFGTPATSVIALGSKTFDIYRLADRLHSDGWSLNTLQFPSGIHICVTEVHTQAGVADRFLDDVRRQVSIIMQEPGKPVDGRMAIYGVAQQIPDRSLVGDITRHYIDSMYYVPTNSENKK